MRLMICGSRDFKPLSLVKDYIDALPSDTVIVTGGARGVDAAAEAYARARGLRVALYMAQWGTKGRGAGFIRNAEMVADCDQGVAFWDGSSRGTAHSIGLLRAAGKLREVITSSP